MTIKDSKVDVCFVIPSSAKKAYQELADVYSAIEPPTWALLLAESLRVHKYDSDAVIPRVNGAYNVYPAHTSPNNYRE